MPPTLTSTSAPRVKAVRALHSGKGRRAAGAFLAEGPTLLHVARAAGATIREVFATPAAAEEHGLDDATLVSADVLAAMAETVTPQGVLAVCGVSAVPVEVALSGPGPVVVVEAISDPGNLGTIIRTADAAGARAVLMTPGSVDPYNGKVVRSSAGSIFHVPCVTDLPVDAAIEACRRVGLEVVGASADGTVPVDSVARPVAWVLGSEAHGLSDQARRLVDRIAYIPMPGRAESLNVAVAAAVCLFAHVPDTRRP